MKRWIEISSNLVFWIVSGWLITSSFSVEAQELEIVNGTETLRVFRNGTVVLQLLVAVGLSGILFYLNLWLLKKISKVWTKRNVILLSGLSLILVYGLYETLSAIFFSNSPALSLGLLLGVIIFYYTVSLAYGIGKIALKAEAQQQQLAFEKKQAELTLLRNQLQPHFLFNALNNLLAMVDQHKTPLLADSIERLSQLLRYVIDEAATEKVSIQKEITFLENFAELQLLRFEAEEVAFNLEVIGNYKDTLIEPGLFIPFMENAFKYGAQPEQQNSIEVSFDLSKKDRIDFNLKNKIHQNLNNTKREGTGINAAKNRLNLVYPNKHRLQISDTDYFTISLQIETL